MATSVYLKRGTTAQWAAQNPVLASGEIAYDTTTRNLKLGDQGLPWSELSSAFVGIKGLPGSSLGLANRVQWLVQPTAPDGWVACNGNILSTEQYPELQNLPVFPGFAGGIGNFSIMQGGGTNYGYGPGQSFASTDVTGLFPNTINSVFYPAGSGALLDDPAYYWQGEQNYATSIWGYKFHRPVVINKFAVSSQNSSYDFGNIQFQGSNDGLAYATIWNRPETTFLPQQGTATPITVTNTTAYLYYRFIVGFNTFYYNGTVAAAKIALEGVPILADPELRQVPNLVPIAAAASTFYPYLKL
jgi:hypothetical protein